MVAAAILPEGDLTLHEVSINPTRTGILDVFEQAGIDVELGNLTEEMGEPVADVRIRSSAKRLAAFTIEGSLVPRLLDEIPVLAVLATQCTGTSYIRDAGELRVKESDRIDLIARGLRAMGASVETYEDGLSITGPSTLSGTLVDCQETIGSPWPSQSPASLLPGRQLWSDPNALPQAFPRLNRSSRG